MPAPVKAITVEHFFQTHGNGLQLKLVAGAAGLSRKIRETTVNRPGLALAGFFEFFANKRVQVIGRAENTYLKHLPAQERAARIKAMFDKLIPCLIYARNIHPCHETIQVAETEKVPLFRSPLVTMKLINAATIMMEKDFAPQTTELGSMVDIAGVGVLIRGKSGIGKSESVLALIERGFSLVSDDVTRIRLHEGQLIGTCPDVTRHHMEVRGLGIINVASVFGIGSIREQKHLELIVSLVDWHEVDEVDRIGLEDEFYDILGVKVRHVTIPVRPGRDIARMIEVAALDSKLKSMGCNTAQEFNNRLIARMQKKQ